MKQITTIITGVALVCIIACTKKAMPTIPERPREEVLSKDKTVTRAITPDVSQGKSIFMNRCGRCHDLPQPSQYNANRWEKILATMAPKARLNEDQAIHVKAYLVENA